MSPRDTDRVVSAKTMESGLGPVDAPPSAEAVRAAAERYVAACSQRLASTELYRSNLLNAFLAGANWRARQ